MGCRTGDVYREIKAGAVFRAERGPKRSELAPGVYVDTPAEDSMRYVARRTVKGGFGWLLYQLALDGGLEQAKPRGRHWRRRALDLASGRGTLSCCGADRRSLPCQRTCVGCGSCSLRPRDSRGSGLGWPG